MSMWRNLIPWAGIIAGVLGWGLSHQIGSNSVFDDCTARGGGFVLLVGAVALLLTILGGLISLGVWRSVTKSNPRRFVGLLSALLALLAAFAVALQSIAGLILPACAA